MNHVWTSTQTPTSSPRLAQAGEQLALLALTGLACSALFKVSFANVSLLLLLLATLMNGAHAWRVLRHEPLLWIALLFAAMLIGHGLLTPPLAEAQVTPMRAAGHYIKGTFLPAVLVGYWLYRRPGMVTPLLLLLPLGLLLRVAMEFEPADLGPLMSGDQRATFGDSAVHFGIWSVVVLLCGVWALTRGLLHHGLSPRGMALLGYGLMLVCLAIAGMLFSHSRTSWILGAILVPLLWLLLVLPARGQAPGRSMPDAVTPFLFPSRPQFSRFALAQAGLGLFAGLLALVWLTMPELLHMRWQEMQQALPVVFSGNWAEAPEDSLGFRIMMYREGWLLWLERPWLGWGPGAEAALLTDPREAAIARFHHFHNNLLTMLAELGIPGGLFFLLVFAVPGYYAARAWRGRDEHAQAALLALVCLLLLFGAAMGDNIFTSYRGPFVIALFAGIAVAAQLRCRERSQSPGSHQPSPISGHV